MPVNYTPRSIETQGVCNNLLQIDSYPPVLELEWNLINRQNCFSEQLNPGIPACHFGLQA